MPYQTIEKEELFYTLSPSKTEKALVLIHGSGGDHKHWPASLRDLSGIRVFAIDLPGHGRSQGVGKDSVDDYSDIIEKFVAGLGLTDVILMGHSLGSAIVQMLALKSPGWLSGIVLVGAGARLRVAPVVLDGILSDADKTIELIGEQAFGPQVSPELVAAFRDQLASTDPNVTHGDFTACDRFDVMAEIQQVRVPTLVISADGDNLTPEKYGQFLSSTIPGAKFALIKDAGHMMALEQTEHFMEYLKKFLNL